jgi:hypothetical protein
LANTKARGSRRELAARFRRYQLAARFRRYQLAARFRRYQLDAGMTESYVVLWSRAFALTFFVEAALLVPLLGSAEPRLLRRISIVLLANIASHPAVWFIIPEFGLSYLPRIAVSEAWAVLLELWAYALFMQKLSIQRAFALALGANALSVIVGLGLRALGLHL